MSPEIEQASCVLVPSTDSVTVRPEDAVADSKAEPFTVPPDGAVKVMVWEALATVRLKVHVPMSPLVSLSPPPTS